MYSSMIGRTKKFKKAKYSESPYPTSFKGTLMVFLSKSTFDYKKFGLLFKKAWVKLFQNPYKTVLYRIPEAKAKIFHFENDEWKSILFQNHLRLHIESLVPHARPNQRLERVPRLLIEP